MCPRDGRRAHRAITTLGTVAPTPRLCRALLPDRKGATRAVSGAEAAECDDLDRLSCFHRPVSRLRSWQIRLVTRADWLRGSPEHPCTRFGVTFRSMVKRVDRTDPPHGPPGLRRIGTRPSYLGAPGLRRRSSYLPWARGGSSSECAGGASRRRRSSARRITSRAGGGCRTRPSVAWTRSG